MVYASEDLQNEHKGVLFGLKILEEMVRLQKENQSLAIEDARGIVQFLQLFADKCHHGKEEQMYFPSLEAVGVGNQKGPIGQMLLEHIEGRKYIAQMAQAVDGSFKADDFARGAMDYITLMRDHIEKENTVLFPMGDKLLPADKQAQLLHAFETFEEEVMGPGTHEKLHGMLNQFEEKYLKKPDSM